jgi:hypothetical protein
LPHGLPIGTVVADGDGFRVALLADAAQSESVQILNFARPQEPLPEAAARPRIVMPPISQTAPADAGTE